MVTHAVTRIYKKIRSLTISDESIRRSDHDLITKKVLSYSALRLQCVFNETLFQVTIVIVSDGQSMIYLQII